MPHLPVLLSEVLKSFENQQLKVFVDGTLGAAGHSSALLSEHPEIEQLIGFDQDPQALKLATQRLESHSDRVTFVHHNFSALAEQLDTLGVEKVDGILLDIGVSSMQMDSEDRGFSFRYDAPLDMRMNPEQELTAAEIVNTWSEQDLVRIFRAYGEEQRARAAVRAIVSARPFETTQELLDAIVPVLRVPKSRSQIHPATKVFQALRIAVNGELDVLKAVIPAAIERLRPGGRLAIITFHSLEDRIVKRAFRYAADDKENSSGIGGVFVDKDPIIQVITRKPIGPTEEEIEENPRARSAKLRVVEKL